MMNTINCDKKIKMMQFNISEEYERARIWQNEGGSKNTSKCELWLDSSSTKTGNRSPKTQSRL